LKRGLGFGGVYALTRVIFIFGRLANAGRPLVAAAAIVADKDLRKVLRSMDESSCENLNLFKKL
jgi:hypothetical protein